VAVLAVTHLRKKEGAAIYRAMGSLAFVAAARAAWLVAKDPKQPQRRLFMPLKNNLAADTSGLAFKIESDATTSQPIIHWSPDPIDTSAETIALVEVPPFGDFHPGEAACIYGRLSDDREWFVQTPVEIKLRDGIVSAVKTPNH
jgi:hypothetical protein